MNHGQASTSPTIRAVTDERVLAAYRVILVTGLSIIGFFLVRLVAAFDKSEQKMDEFKLSIQSQVSEFKIDVAKSSSTNNAMIAAIQNRIDAQSQRMDGFGIELREVNKKLYDRRIP